MFNYRNTLGIIALVCTIAGLAGCGGASGTGSDTTPIKTCGNFQIVLADGSCGAPPPPPPCADGFIRATADSACVKSDFKLPTMPATVAADEAVIYFNKADKNFAGYTLYTWQACSPTWLNPSSGWTDESQKIQGTAPDQQDPIYGAYFVVKLKPGGTCGNFIIRSAGQAKQTNDLTVTTAATGSPFDRRYFVIADPADLRNSRTSALPICINDVCEAFKEPKLAISNIAAHWIDASTIVWDNDVTSVKLYVANEGAKISANEDGTVANGTAIAQLSATSLTDAQKALVPHLQNYKAYSISLSNDVIKSALKQELVIVGQTAGGNLVGTRLQTAHVLDALYTSGANDANEAKLGVAYKTGNVSASVWAPTAKKVELRVYSDALAIESTKTMTEDKATGIWSYAAAKAELDRKFYRYRVTVFNAFTNKTEVLETTDPESISLSTNGLHSQFVDLNDADIKPAGWDGQVVPQVASPEAMTIYETHVRDFSVNDQSTPAPHRGKYLAFTDTNSAPVKHLKALADSGLTHIHLLPIADGSSIQEDASKQINLDSYVFELCAAQSPRDSASVCNGVEKPNATLRSVMQKYAGDSDKQRVLMDSLKDFDAFNWDYDPEHYNAPEGSYATNAKGVTRILETRAMNMALHNLGLRVVYDVVYPHMASAGVKTANSTFDKIVPGYYFRQNIVSGGVETGTGAGPDTATEHVMAGKFMTDSLVQWASAYKVDGFRFDQSGYLPKATLVAAYNAVKAVDPTTYFYAEAWAASGGTSSARVAELASQKSLAGTGIGTFNDVIRNPLREFALVNGGKLDAVRAGLAGNLADFRLLSKSGKTVKASSVGAYNLNPQEAINYVDVHDDATLWDWMHKPGVLPANTSIDNRVRIQDLTLAVPIFSQGVPLIHAGSDILRSKSMTSNSYNAGDWFNALDFTKQSNNWMVGLPSGADVSDANVLLAFADVNAKPTPALIQKSSDVFNEFLRISKSSPLFSLTSAADVMDRVGFHDGGVTQKDNLIVMSIDDGAGKVSGTQTNRADLDPAVDAIVVIFNGSATAASQKVLTATGFVLHSIQKNSVDDAVRTASFTAGAGGGTFTVPAYSVAVFVKPQVGAQGAGLSATATSGYEPPVPYGDTAIYVRGGVSSAGWDATATNKMKYEGNGVYSVALNVPAGTNGFKVAEANWSLPNLGSSQAVTVGKPMALVQGSNDNINITLAAAGEYRFELNALQSTTAPVLTVTNPDTFKGEPVYLRGTVSSAGWDATSVNKVAYEGNSIYALKLDMVPGDYVFKVASNDWSTVNMGTALPVTLGAELPISQGSNDNIPIKITKAATYRFEVNTRKPDAAVIKVYQDDLFKDTPIYARGTVSSAGWDATSVNKFTYKGAGLYTLGLSIAAGDYVFKIAETGWSNPNLGAPSTTLGVPTDLVQGSNDNVALKIPAAGDYVFTVNTTKADAVTVTVDSK
jgi:pullulanase